MIVTVAGTRDRARRGRWVDAATQARNRLPMAFRNLSRHDTLVPVRLVGTGTLELDRDRTAITTVATLTRSDFPKTSVCLSRTGRLQPQKPRT